MAKVTRKFQVTLPKAVANQYGIEPGDELQFQPAGGHILISKASTQSESPSVQEQLRLFDNATARIKSKELDSPPTKSQEREWSREDLYQRGLSD